MEPKSNQILSTSENLRPDVKMSGSTKKWELVGKSICEHLSLKCV